MWTVCDVFVYISLLSGATSLAGFVLYYPCKLWSFFYLSFGSIGIVRLGLWRFKNRPICLALISSYFSFSLEALQYVFNCIYVGQITFKASEDEL